MLRTLPLNTENLYLRKFEEGDIQAAFDNWMSDKNVSEFLTWNTHKNVNETRRIINSWILYYKNGTMDWCITLRPDLVPVGSITAVQDFPEKQYCEIGYCIAERCWNKGYMSEAIKAVVCYIFSSTDYMWIQARYDSENEASGKCLRKCKFRKVGEVTGKNKNGKERQYVIMRIDRP